MSENSSAEPAMNNQALLIFVASLLLNLTFYASGLLMGKTVFQFANETNTDGSAYYRIALDPFSEPPVESGFRYATFLYPLLVNLVARGNQSFTAIGMELINIVAFSVSVAFFYLISKKDGLPLATVFYALNPILLISTHGGMNEPVYYALMFGGLWAFRNEKLLPTSLFLSLAVIARPDFFIFALPYFALAKGRRFLPYLIIIGVTIAGFGYYLISRFGLEHFIGFARGSDLPPQLGIPFATFIRNRFLGETATPQIRGGNLIINEVIAWAVFAGILLSFFFMMRKKHRDGFSLSLLAFGSIIQPAYSYFSGFFRFISMAPSLYKLPAMLFKRRILLFVVVIYAIFGVSLLVSWFF